MAQNALRVVEQAIGEPLKPERKIVHFPPRKKNPAAVALGKLGGRKGGRARAAKLSPEARSSGVKSGVIQNSPLPKSLTPNFHETLQV